MVIESTRAAFNETDYKQHVALIVGISDLDQIRCVIDGRRALAALAPRRLQTGTISVTTTIIAATTNEATTFSEAMNATFADPATLNSALGVTVASTTPPSVALTVVYPASPVPSPPSPPDESQPGTGGLSTGALAGIIVGCVIVAIVVIGFLVRQSNSGGPNSPREVGAVQLVDGAPKPYR